MFSIDNITFNVTADKDPRNWKYPEELLVGERVEKSFSRRDLMPEVLDQGPYGSCIGQTARTVLRDTDDHKETRLSPMCIYKNSQRYDKRAGEDYSGSNFSAACKALLKDGVCTEEFWPYGYMNGLEGWREDAAPRKIYSYYTVKLTETDKVQKLLKKESLMIAFKASSFIFTLPPHGIVDTEGYLNSNIRGGHAVALIGYRYINGVLFWEMQNSWSKSWGNEGRFWMSDNLLRKINIDDIYILVTQSDHQKELEAHKKKLEERNIIIKTLEKIKNGLKGLFYKLKQGLKSLF